MCIDYLPLSKISALSKILTVLLGIIGVVIVIVLLRSYDITAMSDIIKTILTALVSFAGGYGFGKSQKGE